MKLVRYGTPGKEKPGLIDPAGTLRDLSSVMVDIDANALGRDGLARIASIDPSTLPVVAGQPRYGAPVAHVSKMICVGMNYAEHAAETNAAVPELVGATAYRSPRRSSPVGALVRPPNSVSNLSV